MTTNPLKIQTATTPASLKEMTTAEMDYMAYVVQTEFATLTTGVGTLQVNPGVETGLTSIGSVDDYELDAAPGSQVGTSYASAFSQGFQTFYAGFGGSFFTGFFTGTYATNPYGTTFSSNYQTFYGGFGGTFFTGFFVGRANTTITNYEIFQDLQSESESLFDIPHKYVSGQGTITMSETQFNDVVIDHALDNMAAGGIGSYSLSTTTPAGGTWTSRGTIIDAASGGDTTYTLWQKTADTAPTTVRPLYDRLDGNSYDLIEFTDAQMQTWLERFQNQIVATQIGTYAFQATAPVTGTWAQVGDDLTETEQDTYVGAYSGVNATYRGRYVAATKTTSTTLRLWIRTA